MSITLKKSITGSKLFSFPQHILFLKQHLGIMKSEGTQVKRSLLLDMGKKV